jgi:hypothetical protein
MNAPSYRTIFAAATDPELDRAADVLNELGVPFDIGLEPVLELEAGSRVCYQRLVIRVPTGEETRSREALAKSGMRVLPD